jgi:hypothetical protein
MTREEKLATITRLMERYPPTYSWPLDPNKSVPIHPRELADLILLALEGK